MNTSLDATIIPRCSVNSHWILPSAPNFWLPMPNENYKQQISDAVSFILRLVFFSESNLSTSIYFCTFSSLLLVLRGLFHLEMCKTIMVTVPLPVFLWSREFAHSVSFDDDFLLVLLFHPFCCRIFSSLHIRPLSSNVTISGSLLWRERLRQGPRA